VIGAQIWALLDGAAFAGPRSATQTLATFAVTTTVAVILAAQTRAVRRRKERETGAGAVETGPATTATGGALLAAIVAAIFGETLAALRGAFATSIASVRTFRGRHIAFIASPAFKTLTSAITANTVACRAIRPAFALRAIVFGVTGFAHALVALTTAVNTERTALDAAILILPAIVTLAERDRLVAIAGADFHALTVTAARVGAAAFRAIVAAEAKLTHAAWSVAFIVVTESVAVAVLGTRTNLQSLPPQPLSQTQLPSLSEP